MVGSSIHSVFWCSWHTTIYLHIRIHCPPQLATFVLIIFYSLETTAKPFFIRIWTDKIVVHLIVCRKLFPKLYAVAWEILYDLELKALRHGQEHRMESMQWMGCGFSEEVKEMWYMTSGHILHWLKPKQTNWAQTLQLVS